jgi:hypothetical protein
MALTVMQLTEKMSGAITSVFLFIYERVLNVFGVFELHLRRRQKIDCKPSSRAAECKVSRIANLWVAVLEPFRLEQNN